ncbi:MAG: hypothetical protein ACW99Q_29710, partial [Candidatus Kariarchaeaceae archaeon]
DYLLGTPSIIYKINNYDFLYNAKFSISPDLKFLAIGGFLPSNEFSDDIKPIIYLWEIKNNEYIYLQTITVTTFPIDRENRVLGMVFSPNSKVLISTIQGEGFVGLWHFKDSGFQDFDVDGMPDYWEQQYGLQSNHFWDKFADPDQDGLINSMEYNLNTNPLLFDTDGDGISDSEENGLVLNVFPISPNQSLDLLTLGALIGLIILGGLLGFIIKRSYDQSQLGITPYSIIMDSYKGKDLQEVFHKLVIGLENAKHLWLTRYPDDEIDGFIERETEDFSMMINIFPKDMQSELKSELRGRTVTILIELAYQYPRNAPLLRIQ